MSDEFDHEADAWDTYDRTFEQEEGGFFSRKKRKTYAPKARFHMPTMDRRVVHHANDDMEKFELVTQVTETPKAHLLVFNFYGQTIERWLPKSQIEIPFADVVEIPKWLVKRIKDEIESNGQTDE